MPETKLDRQEFELRFRAQYPDPAFNELRTEMAHFVEAAWTAYDAKRKSPNTRKAGDDFSDPNYDLSVDWIAAREAILSAQQEHDDPDGRSRLLLINASPRNDHTCPGEISKTWRLIQLAKRIFEEAAFDVEVLDLSRVTAEYGRNIHPCKACFSTAAPLCHWPCSCYPNYSLGQTQDWMNDIYPMWVRAHGVMIITPVHWYQVTSPLKLMMDRLVCADGGNPDPTLTEGKDAAKAKRIELAGWDYSRHLAGRSYSVVVHGDVEGAENVRRSISDWLSFMRMIPAGYPALLDRYIGYWKPYATSHAELDRDQDFQDEVGNAARTLLEAVREIRSGNQITAGRALESPRQK